MVVGLVVVVFAAGCGSGVAGTDATDNDLRHVHDLVLVDDGVLLVASHTGLYRIESVNRAVLIGAERHDLMAMAEDEAGALIASGHPDLRIERYRVDGQPPFLGLIRSIDGGETWETPDLLGDADFHALAPVDGGLFAVETVGRVWYRDNGSGEWTRLGSLEARDLAIDPTDSDRQLAPDHEGRLWVSHDGAMTWTPLEDAPAVVEVEWPDAGAIVAIDRAGTVWTSEEPATNWQPTTTGPAGVETFYVDGAGSWWVSVEGGAISRSDDEGSTWNDVFLPPVRP